MRCVGIVPAQDFSCVTLKQEFLVLQVVCCESKRVHIHTSIVPCCSSRFQKLRRAKPPRNHVPCENAIAMALPCESEINKFIYLTNLHDILWFYVSVNKPFRVHKVERLCDVVQYSCLHLLYTLAHLVPCKAGMCYL